MATSWSKILVVAALVCSAGIARAGTPDKDGWVQTGFGVRTKSIAFVSVNVYEIHHYMKVVPAEHTKHAVIDADVDKKIEFKMMRDVGSEKIKNAFEEGFERNGYSNAGNIAKFSGAVSGDELVKGSWVHITYSAATKATTITVDGGSKATVTGADFMKAVWSIWFGKFDQPALALLLIKDM
jgi:hypothetical protein